MSNPKNDSPHDGDSLEAELEEVRQQLYAAIDELYSPLHELVRSQIDRALPLVRAAIVLAAGVGNPDTASLRNKRILLAAALEMLYVALQTHRLLLSRTSQNGTHGDDYSADKSWLGSVILAGDYCFSRAAILAARTDSPEVVKIFASALKAVSEDNLRHHFTHTAPSFDEDETLYVAGAKASAILAERTEEEILAVSTYSLEIAKHLSQKSIPFKSDFGEGNFTLVPAQRARWQTLLRWLAVTVRP